MEESNNIIDTSISKNKINQENISLNVNPSNTDDKSTFEKTIIEAFRQENVYECMKKLTIAYDEIKFYIKDIKSSNGKNFILNRNLLDKLNRLVERKYININVLIGKIFNDLLETSNFEILSNDTNLLIQLSNQILNNLDIIKTTNVSLNLEKKCSTFLNFLLQNKNINLDDEQKEILQDLLNSFPSRYNSETYKNFKDIKDNIIQYCQSDQLENKIEGIDLLISNFNNTFSIHEQFDLLFQYVTQIVKSLINKPNIDYKKAYFQLGNFITCMLYSIKFKVKIESEANIQMNVSSKSIFLFDNIKEDEKEKENIHLQKSDTNNSMKDLSFLNNCLFELTDQKDILIKSENIIPICLLILNALIIYDKLFDLQYVCFLLLKKLYFLFPEYRKNIEDLITKNLINLCIYKKKEERLNTIECRLFLHYLLKNGEDEELKLKLNKVIEEKGDSINIELEETILYDKTIVEYENLNFSNFNLRIAYPYLSIIDAGNEYSKYIEVDNPNSLIYIGVATNNYDINVKLFKYCPNITNDNNYYDDLNDNKHFIEIYKIERIDCSEIPLKIILFCKEKGIYKLVFDNSYSWFNSKTVRYRLSVLKLISENSNIKNMDNLGINENDKIEVDVQI